MVSLGGSAAPAPASLGSLEDCTFRICGLVMEGAAWNSDANTLALSSSVRTSLGPALFTWMPRAEVPEPEATTTMVTLPVYLNQSRRQLLFNVQLRAPVSIPISVWQQRGVCLLTWTPRV